MNILDPIQGEGAPDILTDIVSFRTTIDTVKSNCIVAGASQHLKELSNVLVEIYRMKKATSPKPDDEIEKTQNTVTNEVEQLRLRAASLPQDDGRKSTWAMLADLISHYWTAGERVVGVVVFAAAVVVVVVVVVVAAAVAVLVLVLGGGGSGGGGGCGCGDGVVVGGAEVLRC